MVREEVHQTKIYRSDYRFLEYLRKRLRIPRIRLLSMAISLLALAVLKPDETYSLYQRVIKEYEEEME